MNALSSHLMVEVRQNGHVYRQEYERGKILYDLKIVGEASDTGTTITFLPDVRTGETPEPGIFETGEFNFETLSTRFREMAFLNKGLRITLTDERGEESVTKSYCYEGGVISFVEYLNRHKTALFNPPIYIESEQSNSSVEVALQWNDGYYESVSSFANNILTPGGRHAPGRLPRRAHARSKRLCPQKRPAQGQRAEPDRRRYPRGIDGHHLREAHRAAVRGANQEQAGQFRGAPVGG